MTLEPPSPTPLICLGNSFPETLGGQILARMAKYFLISDFKKRIFIFQVVQFMQFDAVVQQPSEELRVQILQCRYNPPVSLTHANSPSLICNDP